MSCPLSGSGHTRTKLLFIKSAARLFARSHPPSDFAALAYFSGWLKFGNQGNDSISVSLRFMGFGKGEQRSEIANSPVEIGRQTVVALVSGNEWCQPRHWQLLHLYMWGVTRESTVENDHHTALIAVE